jgi:predicted nucleic-acid-binding protein
MIGLDTNILIRWLTGDHEAYYSRIKQYLLDNQDEGFYLSMIVIMETWWVLLKVYDIPESEIAKILKDLSESAEIEIERYDVLQKTLIDFNTNDADFQDLLISNIHKNAGCKYTVTLDIKAGLYPDMKYIGGE